ncbi:conserved hypothetical protein [Denitrovibrio acetiphilus DSM 12809]|uniref:Uncharacterized protein n=1 Tax=Denitrovibrio acetiphilus (strain DSM 12809 / NBRC 114555 / N2460) TaxID=522772 RepID=D4H6A1_DENA2|nr:conserved hypothetical protein [Denitrovibrio acetiphilus DSM 12809]
MSINFDVVIDSPDQSVDMKAGLDTLQGVSDATRSIAEFLLNERVVQRRSHKSQVRTNLKKTFKGSYGHIFSLDIYDVDLKRKFNQIGKDTFAELMMFYICESLYLETNKLSEKAEKILEKLGDNSEDLIKQLRVSCLENIHEISTKFYHKVTVNLRKSRDNRRAIAEFNESTAMALQATAADEKYDIEAGVTRFNIFTGNGRLMVKDTTETVAFGLEENYSKIEIEFKKQISENLSKNNVLDLEKWSYLKFKVQPLKLQDGKVVKYIITGFYNGK